MNLHLVEKKKSKNPGDDDQMIKCRQRFLNKGYYKTMAEGIVAELGKTATQESLLDQKLLLDIGCGEGYYLNCIRQQYPNMPLAGLDLSKAGVRLTAKRKLGAATSVASAFDIPLFDNCCDIALSVFSPLCPSETARILKPGGKLVMAGPGANHLNGLVRCIYSEAVEHKGNFREMDSSTLFKKEKTLSVTSEITVANEDIMDLLRMTPYYWHARPEQQEALANMQVLNTSIHFEINTYRLC